MNNELNRLYLKLNSLSVLRGLLKSEIIRNLNCLLCSISRQDAASQLASYSDFARSVYRAGGDLASAVRDLALSGEDDIYLDCILSGSTPSRLLSEALDKDLRTLDEVAALKPDKLISVVCSNIREEGGSDSDVCFGPEDFPLWDNSEVSITCEYRNMISDIDTKGYGTFRNFIMFTVENGEVIPVQDPSYKPLDKFYGYKRERGEVLRNTEVLACGGTASNVLLYGDAGTGKSSTVKASAAAFADRGVRLIEFNKSQVSEIPAIAAGLKKSPLKFIFYVDDLSFTDSDDSFYCLKGILEGNVSGQPSNIVIYATSNRRHLVRESMEARQGDDIHLNDTLQEVMSVSARFGLTITFQKPAKDLYLEIVKELADEYGIVYEDEDDLYKRAEAFAIRANGRSPRTARQFITLAAAGMR